MKKISLVILIVLFGCTQPRVKRYEELLNPLVGSQKKTEVTKVLGTPAKCETVSAQEVCEYRTAAGRNEFTPDVHRKSPGMGPDLAPYSSFDVLKLTYDELGILKDWQPVHVAP